MIASLFLIGAMSFLSVRSAGAVDVFVTAVAGQPYGVATVEIPLAQPVVARTLPPIQATEADGRILFPVSQDIKVDVPRPSETPVPRPGEGRLLGRIGKLIREITQSDPELEQTVARRVTFLFVGRSPLKVSVGDANGAIGTYEVVSDVDPEALDTMISQWWTGYTDAARSQMRAGDYPSLVENYLIAMLARRTGMPLPDWYTDGGDEDGELLSPLKLLAGTEGVSETIFRRSAIGMIDRSGRPLPEADLPLPPPPRWSPLMGETGPMDPALADVPVEPLATRVPPECFYIRYGSFKNYSWFSDLSKEYGGDISSMITLRGIDVGATQRIEHQLNLKSTELSRMLGPTVIEDQAIIGRDLLINDGASLGVIFKATNAFLLRTSFNNDRIARARNDGEVSLKDLSIGGHSVSLLSTADNRVRSFMVQDGNYFLVTNSRELAERFIEVGKDEASLASTASFQLARRLMPLERQDTVFVYFSPQMLRGLLSPGYLIELRRRLAANAEIAMMHLARLAADQETAVTGESIVGIDEMIDAGFLPVGFGLRPDGSGAVKVGDAVMDTRRGMRGRFMPIADVAIETVTPREAAWYFDIAQQYELRFPTIDPIMIGVGRETIPADGDNPGGERIMVHAEVAPWGPEKYGQYAKYLGPPTDVAMQFAADDIIAVQAHVASEQLGPPTHLFAAIKDTVPPQLDDFDGILNTYHSLRGIPGYVGAWPQPGMLDRLPLGIGRGQPVGPGMNRLIGGLYRYTDGQFSVLSFQPEVLNASLPFLAAIDVPDTAQIRARAGNLHGSQIEYWVNSQLYDRARRSSVAGASLLSLLGRQLDVAPENARAEIERILGSPIQCTLGGRYEYSEANHRWVSTAWDGPIAPSSAPVDYVAPPMQWFRGAAATVTQYPDRLVADAVIDIER